MAGRPKKYTIDYCLNEIKEIHDRLMADNGQKAKYITWQDLIRDKEYSQERISEWRKTFADDDQFSQTIKKIERELENRLFKIGLSSRASSTMAIFGLKNNYGWKDKHETDITTGGEKLQQGIDLSKLSDEALKEIINAARKDQQ